MEEFQQYNLEPIQDSGIPTSPAGVSAGASNASAPYTSQQDTTNYASRIETLEKALNEIKGNYAKKGEDANFSNVFVADKLTARFGNVAGWDVDRGVMSTNKLTIDSNNQWIRSNNYQAGTSGFTIQDNLLEAENIFARGTLKGVSFAYDVVSAVGGQLMVCNSDVLAENMTSADNSTMTIKGSTTFAVNDILLMQGVATSGIQSEWMRVTSATLAPIYTVTRDLAGSFSVDANPEWKAGTPVVKQGVSNGTDTYSGGWLRLIGEGTNAPYYSVFARNGLAYNNYVETCRLGNLNGFLDYTDDVYGIALGDDTSNLTYDTINGFRLRGVASEFFISSPSDNLKTSADATQSTTSTTYVKVKEVLFNDVTGNIRVKFDLYNGASARDTGGQIYKNGTAVGTERRMSGTTPVTYSEDISVTTGDLIQLYIKVFQTEWGGGCSNFRIYYDKVAKSETNTVNLN